jgi:hypothetical protein
LQISDPWFRPLSNSHGIRGKWGYVEHGAKRNILLFLHETCFMQK